MSRRHSLAACVLVSGAIATQLVAGCGGSEEPGNSKGALAPAPSSPATTGSSKPAASSSSASAPADGGTTNTAPDAAVEANCVPKGYGGNDKKIGAYCDNDNACPFQFEPFLVCTVGHDPTNTHLFCTTPCSKDSECGTDAFCVKNDLGAGCVPSQCGGAPSN